MNVVIGTAGHIDHGKTTLVRALTGIDTDRLKEEKARGITIDLGFAHFKLPSGNRASIVDVPGHEKFIKNMLAGVAGIDLALLVVAADEGIMPQTREHLEIIKLLEIKTLVVALTKADLVDAELQELVKSEVNELLEEIGYPGVPILAVSALKGIGLQELVEMLDALSFNVSTVHKSESPARMPIDRVFTVQGYGVVVTGTLFNGKITVGDTVEIPLKKKKARVRNIQIHKESVNTVLAGYRAAINLAGVESGELERGDVLAEPEVLYPSSRLDLLLKLLPSAPRSLKNMERVRFHQGTGEALGRVKILGEKKTGLSQKELEPGEEGYIQLILEEPVTVMRGDHYILRSYSPARTIGGGTVLEPAAVKHKAKDTELLEELVIKASGRLEHLAELLVNKGRGLLLQDDLALALQVKKDRLPLLLRTGLERGEIIELALGEDKAYIGSKLLNQWREIISQEIRRHIQSFPLEPGLNKETLRGKRWLHLTHKEYNALLQYWIRERIITLAAGQFLLPYGFESSVEGAWAEKIRDVEELYQSWGWQLPTWENIKIQLKLEESMAKQILQYLLREKKLIALGENLYAGSRLVDEGRKNIEEWLKTNGTITASQARELLGTTRRVIIPFLEYLDKIHVTQRRGEIRVLHK